MLNGQRVVNLEYQFAKKHKNYTRTSIHPRCRDSILYRNPEDSDAATLVEKTGHPSWPLTASAFIVSSSRTKNAVEPQGPITSVCAASPFWQLLGSAQPAVCAAHAFPREASNPHPQHHQLFIAPGLSMPNSSFQACLYKKGSSFDDWICFFWLYMW